MTVYFFTAVSHSHSPPPPSHTYNVMHVHMHNPKHTMSSTKYTHLLSLPLGFLPSPLSPHGAMQLCLDRNNIMLVSTVVPFAHTLALSPGPFPALQCCTLKGGNEPFGTRLAQYNTIQHQCDLKTYYSQCRKVRVMNSSGEIKIKVAFKNTTKLKPH